MDNLLDPMDGSAAWLPLLDRAGSGMTRMPYGRRASDRRGFSPASDMVARPELLIRLLDELDYGLMLVSDDACVRVANRQARHECAMLTTFNLRDGRVQPCLERDRPAFQQALAAARAGRRTMLSVGPDLERRSVAVVPVRDPPEGWSAGDGGVTLLVFAKRQVCAPLSVEFFAREQRLTRAEHSVLRRLCDGQSPSDIAKHSGVALSTVRTQIASLRMKTGSGTIGELVRRVTMLPPIVPILAQG